MNKTREAGDSCECGGESWDENRGVGEGGDGAGGESVAGEPEAEEEEAGGGAGGEERSGEEVGVQVLEDAAGGHDESHDGPETEQAFFFVRRLGGFGEADEEGIEEAERAEEDGFRAVEEVGPCFEVGVGCDGAAECEEPAGECFAGEEPCWGT